MEDVYMIDWTKHVIELTTLEDGTTIIYFHIPETSFYNMRFIIHTGHLFVSGDLGSAVYCWYSPISLAFFKRVSLDYFCSKCEASQYGYQNKSFDLERVKKDFIATIKLYREDYDPEDETEKEEEMFATINNIDDEHEWWVMLRDYGYEWYGDEWYEWDGKYPSHRAKMHLEAIKYIANHWEEDT